jgi:SigmaW regulon antibacterial.
MGELAFLIPTFLVILLLVLFFSFVPVGLWISAAAADVRVGIFYMIGMKLRRVPPHRIVNALIKAEKAGLEISIDNWRPTTWRAATSTGWLTP